jgi:hypothetical protein
MTLSKVHTLIKVTVLFCAMAYGICVHEYDRDLFYGHFGFIYIYIYIYIYIFIYLFLFCWQNS